MDSNFEFLNRYWPLLYQLGSASENYLFSDPNTAIIKMGQFGEALIQFIMAEEQISLGSDVENTQENRINKLVFEGLLTTDMAEKLHLLRKVRNRAIHKFEEDLRLARQLLPELHAFGCWFMEVYGDPGYIPPDYEEPKKEVKIDWEKLMAAKRKALADKQAELDESQDALAKSREELKTKQQELEKSQEALKALEGSQASLEEKEQEIEAQKREIEQKEAQLQKQEADIDQIKAQIEDQQSELEKKDSELMDQKALLEEQEKVIAQLMEQIKAAKAAADVSPETRKMRAKAAAAKMGLTEAETRMIIDAQLREAGWEVDTNVLRYGNGTRPQEGRNLAIAEWPTIGSSSADRMDYALFVGTKFLGVVEAKRQHTNVCAVLDNQSQRYATHIREEDKVYCVGKWGNYDVPFLFASNGRPYLKQYEQLSGVWFRDARKDSNHGKALQAWYSPEGLLALYETDVDQLNRNLINEPKDYLTDPDGLNLRDYQVKAITKVEAKIIEGQREILLAMATGTGKTRTVLGMIYRFLTTGRFRRILFLVDRNALGIQAMDVFKDVKLQNLQTLDEIYAIKGIGEGTFESDTKVHVSTVHSIIRRLMLDKDDARHLNVSDYDLIIIDEAHRGYTLDKEMSEEELLYRDQEDYVSKFRQVIEYFDAVKIALTATPALHTSEIFGEPVFTYSYGEAVIDGWLVDHEPPHIIETDKSYNGIHFQAGATVPVIDTVTGEILNGCKLADNLDFEIDKFNRKVITPSYNRAALEEICKYIDPFGPEKTLIFAVDDDHADLIVNIIREIYKDYDLPQQAVRKITGSIGDRKTIDQAIKEFKNEEFPTIAVTVDLLTTGIDVPQITNLVFLRQVRSRILYEQMLGRATRRCDEIKKECFQIYDAAHMYESIGDYTSMKAVCPPTSLEDLLVELENVEDEEKVRTTVARITAKLRRKGRRVSDEAAGMFSYLTGETIKGFADRLKDLSPGEAKALLLGDKETEAMLKLDADYVYTANVKVLDEGEDRLASHTRGYGNGQEPADYLESFREFIRTNMNEIDALRILCTRPSDLTRDSLKSLRMELDRNHFSESQLRTAWKETKDQDVAADIIAFIRQQALGSSLMTHEERVRKAFEKLREAHTFNAIQRKWLDKFEATMLKTPVLEQSILDEGSYRLEGGFNRIDRYFGGDLKNVLDELNNYLYEDGGAEAL